MKQRIYIDTSVFGGHFDEEFKEHTIPLFDRIKEGEYIILYSTVTHADFLVSWNFKHIVNIERIKGYNAINIKNGYKQLEIRSPREFEKYEDD